MHRPDIVIRDRQKNTKESHLRKIRAKCAMRRQKNTTPKRRSKWKQKATKGIETRKKKKVKEEKPVCFCPSNASKRKRDEEAAPNHNHFLNM
jgi:hypothetical protein